MKPNYTKSEKTDKRCSLTPEELDAKIVEWERWNKECDAFLQTFETAHQGTPPRQRL